MMTMVLLLRALSLLVASVAAAAAPTHDPSIVKVVEWFTAREGAFLNPKQEIRREIPGDSSSELGIFATEPIAKGEVLISVPWDTTIGAGYVVKEPDALVCDTVHNLIKELRLGEKSEFAPYVLNLLEQKEGQLPSAWSDEGKALLNDVANGFTPQDATTWIEYEWYKDCEGSNDPFEENAAMLVVMRSDDDLMVPVLDLYKHRNGNYLNTEAERTDGVKVDLMASRDIEEGEEIYISMNMCNTCGGRDRNYGTPEIFRDYGFVEQWPQRWVLHDQKLAFDIKEKAPDSDELEITWAGRGKPSNANFFREQILRLESLKFLEVDNDDIPEYERKQVWKYVDAALVALKLAAEDIVGGDMCLGEEVDGTCVLPDSYDRLEDKEDDMYLDDGKYLKPITCDNKAFMTFDDYEEMEMVKSVFQTSSFFTKTDIDDVCFDLDDIVQICQNYRPHYHEYNMDFAARYLDDVRRVVFIGGGDSMLLYEALKYPNIELVVGLELDQNVVRKSFKYFHTEPFFHDERVEWWFGDATKSLLMLPKDYFGSFDLVLVDLSETVMSFPVLDKLDVLEALALLLNPEGIMVKNELYLEHMGPIFDYTAQIYLPDVPSICDQVVVMGSNFVDFWKDPMKDHNVNTLLLKPPDQIDDRFYLFHDYRKSNGRPQGKCDESEELMDESDRLSRHAGILTIADVENTTVPLQPLANIVQSIVLALQKEGLSPLSTVAPSSDDDGMVAVIGMKEGYVVARIWPDHNYCAFDIHLWGAFNKMESVRDALVAAVGSSTASMSSFRIVVGGMHGTSTWSEDQKAIGPRITQKRKCDEAASAAAGESGLISDKSITDIALEETLSLAQNKDIVAAVLCGLACSDSDTVAKNENVRDVITIMTCPDIAGDPQYLDDSSMAACEKETSASVRKAVGERGKISTFILDSSVPVSMLRVLNKILSGQRHQDKFLAENVVFIAVMTDQKETWRKRHNFLDRIRNHLFYDPLFAAELVLNNTNGRMEIGVLSSNDRDFFSHLDSVADNIAKRSSLDVEVRKVQGAMVRYQDNFNPEPSFKLADYDLSVAKEQFLKQKPFGRQSVFQLDAIGMKLSATQVKESLESTIAKLKYSLMEMKEFDDVGDGFMIAAVYSEGSAIVVWDGKTHVDINLFAYDESKEQATDFVTRFQRKIPGMKLSLRDDMPRGIERVINFKDDLQSADTEDDTENDDDYWLGAEDS